MVDEARKRIVAFLARPGMNKVALADLAGVHRNTLNGVKRADWNPNSRTLESLLKVVEKNA